MCGENTKLLISALFKNAQHPGMVNEEATALGVNFSQVLQEALVQIILQTL